MRGTQQLGRIRAMHWHTGSKCCFHACQTYSGAFITRRKDQAGCFWMELQNPPFGYYDTIVCAYLLGYVLRFYKDGEFNWVDNSNNPFPLSEKNLATMVSKLCHGDVVNNTLSSGSEIWQQFRPYAQKLFTLSESECVNEDQARKYIKESIITSGTPLWTIRTYPKENSVVTMRNSLLVAL